MAEDDAQRIFNWRDRPAIREVMFTTGPLDWTEHLAWTRRTLADPDAQAFVFEQAGQAVGYVKLDRGADGWLRWGFYIGAEDALPGSGSRMLFLALDWAFAQQHAPGVAAEVLPGNAASLRLHEKLGFQRRDPDPDSAAQHFVLTHSGWQAARIALSGALFTDSAENGA